MHFLLIQRILNSIEMKQMKDNIFIDTNILVYTYSFSELPKQTIARKLIEQNISFISTQVIQELVNTITCDCGSIFLYFSLYKVNGLSYLTSNRKTTFGNPAISISDSKYLKSNPTLFILGLI